MTLDPVFADARVVVVDDQPANVAVLEQLLARWGWSNVFTTTESAEVVDLCAGVDPDLVLLDLHMPDPDGFRVMELLDERRRGMVPLPILVVTADISRETRRRALVAGAHDFISKPFDLDEVALRVGNLLKTRRLELELERRNVVLDHRVRARTRELEQARMEGLERLALAAEYRDPASYEHPARVGRGAGLIAAALGLDAADAELIAAAAPLHDIGNIGVPDSILMKAGRLSADEFELMKQHTVIGAQILAGAGSPLLRACEEIAATHHERWDGGGYPAGLAGEEIPLGGRITALADVFDALAHARPYKEAWPLAAVRAEIERERGAHFDPAAVDAFMTLDHEALLGPVAAATGPSRGPVAAATAASVAAAEGHGT